MLTPTPSSRGSTRSPRNRPLALAAATALIAAALGACTARASLAAQCTFNGDCAEPLVCAGGFCRAQCATGRDCPTGAHCSSSGVAGRANVCLPPGAQVLCVYNSDCPAPTICARDGLCRAPCNGDRDCLPYGGPSATCTPEHTCMTPVTIGADDGGTPLDANPTDVPDATAPDDTGPAPCNAAVDLTNTTPDDAGVVVVARDTTTTPASGALSITCETFPVPFAHQLALRYRMRRRAFLEVDTQRPGTAPLFDTVAAIFTAPCASSAMQLGCDDDFRTDRHAVTFSDQQLDAGQEVIVAVGGYQGVMLPEISAGNIEVAIREIDGVPLGNACDPGGLNDRCAGGASCVLVTPSSARCVNAVDEVMPFSLDTSTRTSPQALARPAGGAAWVVPVHGNLASMDEDCFSFEVRDGESVLAEVTNGGRDCSGTLSNVIISLFSPSGMELARSSNTAPPPCARLDGTTAGAAHALAAGTYLACVRGMDMGVAVYNYNLSLSVQR